MPSNPTITMADGTEIGVKTGKVVNGAKEVEPLMDDPEDERPINPLQHAYVDRKFIERAHLIT